MAQQIQDDNNSPKKKKKPLNKTAFLCCFGFSGHRRDDNNHHLFSGNKRRVFLFSRKQKSAAKTVPLVDAAAVAVAADEKVNRSKEIHVVKSKTSSKNRQLPVAAGESPVLVPGESFYHKTNKAKTESKTLDHLASKKNISGGPTANKTVLSRTSSAGKSQKKKKSTAAHGGDVDSEHNIDSTRNQQDFMYGMSILMLILIIMLLWGRICAIFCTAAWLYFVPRIKKNQEKEKAHRNNGGVVSNDVVLRFSSAESKQKVVLDGFLERNHRTTIIL